MAHHVHLLVMTGDRPTLCDRPVVTRPVAKRGYLRLWWPEKPPAPPAQVTPRTALLAAAEMANDPEGPLVGDTLPSEVAAWLRQLANEYE
jgi:hypothetical protein